MSDRFIKTSVRFSSPQLKLFSRQNTLKPRTNVRVTPIVKVRSVRLSMSYDIQSKDASLYVYAYVLDDPDKLKLLTLPATTWPPISKLLRDRMLSYGILKYGVDLTKIRTSLRTRIRKHQKDVDGWISNAFIK